MSPSYPKYYQPGVNCSWGVRVPPHQRIITRILDTHLRSGDTCQDVLRLGDTSHVCGEIRSEVTRISDSNNIIITFNTGTMNIVADSRRMFYLHSIYILAKDQSYILPYRGFLVELIPGGCIPETPPLQSELSYLLSYNQSFAVYKCRVSAIPQWRDRNNFLLQSGFVFSDSSGEERTLMCTGHQYDQSLPPCVPIVTPGTHIKNISHTTIDYWQKTHQIKIRWKEKEIFSKRKCFHNVFAGESSLTMPVLHEIVLPTIVTMFTVILSVAACILLIIIKRQWENVPEYPTTQVQKYKMTK